MTAGAAGRSRAIVLLAFALCLGAPLAGGWLRGLPPGFWSYPPLIEHTPDQPPFNAWVWAVFAGIILLAASVYLRPACFGFQIRAARPAVSSTARPMPWWGWAGVALAGAAWVGAWGRFAWLGSLGLHLFAPLWLGYVFTMDGLVYRRAGTSLVARAPRAFLLMFPVSALTWWYFEYVNRFILNWWYAGVAGFSPWHYVAYSTICFSTVFPAIFETRAWLATFRWFQVSYAQGPPWRPWPPLAQAALVVAGAAGALVMAWQPGPFFALAWLAPLAILAGALPLAGVSTPLDDLRRGDYTWLLTLALAALVCGLFWEMWNYWSFPKWNYAVPYVDRWHVFEMPLVGFGGYLPFGPECWLFWLAWQRLMPAGWRRDPGACAD